MRRVAVGGLRWAVVLGLMLVMACDSPAGTDPGPEAPRVGPGVLSALERDGEARVMVSLRTPPGARLGGGSGASTDYVPDAYGLAPVSRLDTRVAQVAELVAGVLDRLGPLREAGGVDVARRFATVPALTLTVRDAAALAGLADDDAVVRIDLDPGGTGALATSVPQTGADVRHERGNTGAGQAVAVLDTGVDTDHPALAGRILHEACFSNNGNCHGGGNREVGTGTAEDDVGHGTHVAGIVASDGEVGAPGMAPSASVVAIRVMYDCGDSAGCFDAFSEIVAGLDHLVTQHDSLGTKVVNMSLGTNTRFEGVCDDVTSWTQAGASVVNSLRELGVILVASSGNNSSNSDMSAPACLGGVLAVAAVDQGVSITNFSNTNAETDIAAPGAGIESLAMGGGTISMSGTSMAAPHVAGCAALLFEDRPSWPDADILARLLTSPDTAHKSGHTMPLLDCSPDKRPPPDPRETVEVNRPG